MSMVRLIVNGRERKLDLDPDMPLLWALRDELKLKGAKYGCGIGACGACTVHVNGQATRACVIAVGSLEGAQVLTIEGLAPEGEHALQRAWVAEQVPQCGYCQPGQIMSAAALLARNAAPTDAEIDAAMAGNLCRCGTYPRIRAAIKRAAAGLRKEA
jgi:aerobic-type carbon monoxide dehydrogenase small subunit (CoxS/CutS family)